MGRAEYNMVRMADHHRQAKIQMANGKNLHEYICAMANLREIYRSLISWLV